MSRHEKWVRVEPGTVIPAGQPYAIDCADDPSTPTNWIEYIQPHRPTIAGHPYLVDSSWSPPLELPTPTCPLCDGQHKMTACPDYPAYQRWVKNREANQ